MQRSETQRLISKFADETTLPGISNIIKSKSSYYHWQHSVIMDTIT